MSRRAAAIVALGLACAASASDGDEVQPVAWDRLPQPSIGQIPDTVRKATLDARNLPLPQRMKAVSEPLLGLPYLLDPLGEGTGWDPDPLARYDALDCLTFLEEVLALALAGDPEHAAGLRNALRYGDGPRDYAHRRHFMELQWLPGNVAAGLIRPISADLGQVTTLHKAVSAATWAGWSRRSLFHLADAELPTGDMTLDVLPIAEALRIVDHIPPGTLVLTVRVDRPSVPIWISHVGFTIPADRPTVRHETKMKPGESRDHDLAWYLAHLRTYRNWPALGVSLYAPLEQGPRRIDASVL